MGETNFSLSNYTAFLYIYACLRNFFLLLNLEQRKGAKKKKIDPNDDSS